MELTIKVSEEEGREWEYYLRRRYGKKSMRLERLAKIAIRSEVEDEAKIYLAELIRNLETMADGMGGA